MALIGTVGNEIFFQGWGVTNLVTGFAVTNLVTGFSVTNSVTGFSVTTPYPKYFITFDRTYWNHILRNELWASLSM